MVPGSFLLTRVGTQGDHHTWLQHHVSTNTWRFIICKVVVGCAGQRAFFRGGTDKLACPPAFMPTQMAQKFCGRFSSHVQGARVFVEGGINTSPLSNFRRKMRVTRVAFVYREFFS